MSFGDLARISEVVVLEFLSSTEINKFDLWQHIIGVREKNVLWLQVSVDQAVPALCIIVVLQSVHVIHS